MKLGSLFDGSGGFPLAGALCGIEPIWASEVEPYPIAVTKTRFPTLKHLGDISKINGAEIEPVDIITFGSPCQDLSVAGKRAGLKHEDNGDDETTRSGLFMEAVRIIKEMREKTNGEYPRFAVWENVPGAFSSNKGEDFRIVLEELVKVVEPTAVMPAVPQFGWAYADSYCGDGWSLAYRVFDAQYWGVPQRRRRIYLVADFGGQCAREILFEREGLRGYFTEGRTPWQATPADAERGIGADDREGEIPYTLKIRSGVSVDSYGKAAGKGALIQKNLSATLGVSQDQYLFQPVGADPYNGDLTGDKSATLGVNCGLSTGRNAVAYGVVTKGNGDAFIAEERHTALSTGGGQAGQGYPCTMQAVGLDAYNQALTGDKSKTLNSAASDADHVPCVVVDNLGGQNEYAREGDVAPCLKATHYKNPPCIVEPSAGFCTKHSAKSRSIGFEEEVAPTLRAGVTPACVYSVENHPADSRVNLDESGKVQTLTSRMGTGGGNVPMVMEERPRVINLNKDDVQSKTILDPKGIAPSLYAGECRGGGGECYVMEPKLFEFHGQDVRLKGPLEVAPTAQAGYGEGGSTKPLVVESVPALTASKASFFMRTDEERASTLVATDYKDPQIVAYGFDPGASRDVGALFIEECGKTLTNGTCPGHHDGVVIDRNPRPVHTITTGSFTQIEEEKSPTLMARDYKDPTCVDVYDAATNRYIVRRLTPTECARLQGFADRWGDIEPKTEFSDEEYRFWHDVRNTHAAINGKAVKEYDKKQMLAWYNKLHTDSSEYKMWGNGIALPTALYVIQGISETMKGTNEND